MESERHVHQMTLLIQSLKDFWSARDDFFVAGNMFVYYSEIQAKKNDFRGPDVFVVMDTEKRERKSWVVWEENGQMPDVVIELVSPSTVAIDRGEKMRIYARNLRVAEYFLFDPFSAELEGYELDPHSASYRPIAKDPEGHLPVKRMGLRLGSVDGVHCDVQAKWLRWITTSGDVVLHPMERAEAESKRAEAESKRAEELVAKVAEYEKRFGPIK